jgi:hypothetical protein
MLFKCVFFIRLSSSRETSPTYRIGSAIIAGGAESTSTMFPNSGELKFVFKLLSCVLLIVSTVTPIIEPPNEEFATIPYALLFRPILLSPPITVPP